MKTSALHLTAFLCIATSILSGCSDPRIPVDEEQARPYIIPVKQAREFTRNFAVARTQLARRVGDSTFLRDTFNLPTAEMFNRNAIALLLNAEGAEGIRIYLGRDAKGQIRLVLLPVDKSGKNIIGKLISNQTAFIPGVSSAYADEGDGEAVENGQRCPTMCDEGW